jgi:hypothetical protein
MPQSLPSTPASFSDLGKVKKCDPYVCTVVITINAIYSINIVYSLLKLVELLTITVKIGGIIDYHR